MKKEIIEIDKEKGIYRITTPDERWYTIETQNEVTGLPYFKYIPSVTWITGFYPKGKPFWKWLADKGWDESEALKVAAGDKGSKIHKACEMLIGKAGIKMEDKFMNNSSGNDEELSVEEYEAICSFTAWANKYKPKFLMTESTVISEKFGFAGTIDCVAKIGDQIYIIDFKSSQYIWPSMEIQLSAYKQALREAGRKVDNIKLAILQLGYKKNKNRYKFTEIEDQFDLFLAARQIWEKETKGQKPSQMELPLEVKLTYLDEPEPEVEKPEEVKKPKKSKKKTEVEGGETQ